MNYPDTNRHQKNLRCLLLNERRQDEKATHCTVPTKGHFGKGTFVEIVKTMSGCSGKRRSKETDEQVKHKEMFRIMKLFHMKLLW